MVDRKALAPQKWLIYKSNVRWRRTLLSEKLAVYWSEVCKCRKTESYLLEFNKVWIERSERTITYLFGNTGTHSCFSYSLFSHYYTSSPWSSSYTAEVRRASPPSSMISIKAASIATILLLSTLSLASSATFNASVRANLFHVTSTLN